MNSQKIDFKNFSDDDGNPAGGFVKGQGLSITWQDGPLGRGEERKEPNGTFVETVIRAAISRMEFYQGGKFACWENALVITKLEEALMWGQRRTQRREEEGVEGLNEGR